MLLEARAISKSYPAGSTQAKALAATSFGVAQGEFIAIVGPSASGKSTLMNLLGLLDRPTSGHLLIEGHDCSALESDALARIRNRRIGFVFQSYQLLARQTALENVELPLVYRGMRASERRRRAAAALDRVGLGHHLARKPPELSGGEQQRVAIARALVAEPSIILADEPTGALDSATAQDVLRLLQACNASGQTLLMVTHDPEIARCATRVFHIRDGVLTPDAPLSRPRVAAQIDAG